MGGVVRTQPRRHWQQDDLPDAATVIGPSIIFSAGQGPAFESSFGVIRVVTELLENQDKFFTVPEDFWALIHDQEYFAYSMELPGKDFMKYELYVRQRSSGRAAPISGRLALTTPT